MIRTHRRPRAGYTLVETLVAMGSATFLLVGLATTLAIATSALDTDFVDRDRAVLGEARSSLQSDLAAARHFTERTANSVTFAVPDRSNDGKADLLRYAWSGTPGDPLTVSVDGGPAATVLEDVQNFDLSYETETFSPPTLSAHAGYPHVYANEESGVPNTQIATRFNVLDPITVTAVTAFVGGHGSKDFRVAVYGDNGGEPDALVVESSRVRTPSLAAWTTVSVPDTPLTPGDYWLAVAFEHGFQSYQYTTGGGDVRTRSHDAVSNGFRTTWGTSDETEDRRISIYAVHGTN